jgi:hypothetical protein
LDDSIQSERALDIRRLLPSIEEKQEVTMANVYVEARPKGLRDGEPIDDYVVEEHADQALATFRTQAEAIKWAKDNGHRPLVAFVRRLNNRNIPDQWRAV